MNLFEQREYMRKWRLAHPNKAREYQRKYVKTKKFKITAKKYHSTAEWRNQNRVRTIVYRAIKKGNLVRQNCEVRNCNKLGEAHHDDYKKYLDVRWLCRLHHSRHHNLKT